MNNVPMSYPITRFAAVIGVKYASSNERDPIPYFAPGGVMLSELAHGEFGMVITGHSYSVTIVAVRVTETWKIVSDTERLEVRFSPWEPGEQLHGETWLYLRFKETLVYSDFNRVLWDIIWRVRSKAQQLQANLDAIGYATPSNFTMFCRQYLGDTYFEQLSDSGSEEGEEGEEEDGNEEGEDHEDGDDGENIDSNDLHSLICSIYEAEASASETGDSEATAVDVL